MSARTFSVGTTRAGVEVLGHELRAGDLRVEAWSFGATLVEVDVPDRDGRIGNVVLRHAGLGGYDDPREPRAYLGAVVGRFANRIAGGRCTIDGRAVALTRNDGPNHLHGGRMGFDVQVWRAIPDDDPARVEYELVSPDGEEGYPGTLTARVRYVLSPEELAIEVEAATDAPTIVNLANHAYWNLAGGGRVDDHELRVAASRYLPVDDTSIPLGGPAPVAGTRFDLRSRRPLGPFDDGGLDHCYLPDGEGFREIAELHDPGSGRTMTVSTDQPAVQVYTAGGLRPEPFTGVCLETQAPPDVPNRPDLGSALLRPGETYRHRTVHRFTAAR